ncbi:sensor histidine kinase [Rubripirellula lacrimiformis]|uniref:sensor histidine kinase n=1 Tax=Rubripirellula lacrimiformis TaxID=1930273 RepID=UPI00119C9D96|nr:ATP-binding protein [Rubripirellula lacrimiformis]
MRRCLDYPLVDRLLAANSKKTRPDELVDSAAVESIGAVCAVAVTALIVITVAHAGWLAAIAVVAASGIIIAILRRRSTDRRLRVQVVVDGYRQEADQWQQQWLRLQQDAEQTQSALQKMRDGVIMLSREGNVLLVNPSAKFLLGIADRSDMGGRRLGEIVRIPELSRVITAAASGDGPQKVHVEVVCSDRIRSIKVRVDPIESRLETKLLVTLRDETEANRVDEMRREFVANISHELKTPLAAIKGYAETVELAIEDDPDAAKHFMSQINAQCLRLERLIADMMQLARAQAGNSHLSIGRVDFSEVVSESLRSNCPIAEVKEIAVVYQAGQSQWIHSDREATLTIANNLIGNAIRYTSLGGRVEVGFRDAGKFLALVVQDNGVGINAEEQERIFERFYRVQKSRVARGDESDPLSEGTGIGLSIVKNLAISLGGEVRVESKPGRGSKFEVLLPKAELA